MTNVLQPLAKSVLIPLRLTAAASAIQKKIFGSCLLIKGVIETIKNEAKKQK